MLGQDIDVTEINEWLQADTNDRGYEHLSDAEIVAKVINQPTSDAVSSDDETEAVAMQGADSSSSSSSSSSSPSITHGHAVKIFDSCIAWLQRQDKSAYNLSVLRDLCELAAAKRLSTIKRSI